MPHRHEADLTVAEIRAGLNDLKAEIAHALRPYNKDRVAVRTALMSDDIELAVLHVYLDGLLDPHGNRRINASVELEGFDYREAFDRAWAWLDEQVAEREAA